MQIEYRKFKGNIPKIVEILKVQKNKRGLQKKTFYLHFREDQFQHSLCDCSQCFKTDALRKVFAKFLIKNIHLKKSKEQWT